MIVNGEYVSVDILKEKNLFALLDYYKLPKEHTAIEYNDTILQQNEYSKVILNEDDKIELIQFVGGGA